MGKRNEAEAVECNQNRGWFNVFRIGSDGEELFIGRVEGTSLGWEEMGCDLYPRLFEAGLIDDPEEMEAAEADIDQTISLIYKPCLDAKRKDRLIQFSEHDICSQPDIFDERVGTEVCLRWMDFNGVGDDRNGWQCVNDCTGCINNDGHNTCGHLGVSLSPDEDES